MEQDPDDLGPAFVSSDGTYIIQENEASLSADGGDNSEDDSRDRLAATLREQDRFLPIANVARIMKRSIPTFGKIAKDARECVQECVSEFISFITSEASDRCMMEKRKTINGEDILFAMSTLGFDNYIEPLKVYLQKYRESMKGEKDLEEYESSQENYGSTNQVTNMIPSGTNIVYAFPRDVQSFQLS
ncbi:uncharacterized protein LOC136032683 isoform X2 [Artemia franciscana]|uniref:uncharacterized protein LOC136032683 isoform X2 n=1 Tax=Artemia franciscana TaxID=6661 RepID=UPI0032DA4459